MTQYRISFKKPASIKNLIGSICSATMYGLTSIRSISQLGYVFGFGNGLIIGLTPGEDYGGWGKEISKEEWNNGSERRLKIYYLDKGFELGSKNYTLEVLKGNMPQIKET